MKKILLTLAVVLCGAMTMMAEPVSPQAAREAAAKFLQARGIQLRSEAMRAKSRAMGYGAERGEQAQASPYYVFNAAAAQGFVVVSGDDCVGENLVLGYTAQGSFDANTVPDNMQWWLDEMERQIAQLSRMGAKAKAVALHEDIAPLVTALWNQGDNIYNPQNPYNAFCPEMDGALCVTGCMATALAQVMYYHRWPQEPTAGPIPGYTSEHDLELDELPVVAFDWQNMVDDYTEETTEAQQNAVATLMRYCGQIIQMDYTPEISNGFFYDMDMLVKLFGYDQEVYTACSDNYTVSGWDNKLYNELKEGRPLVYAGGSSGGGHAFVIDGYQVQDGCGFFHVNWGWGGLDNGFFKIALLDANAHGTGSSSTSDGYNLQQQALIGLQPAKGPLTNYGRQLFAMNWNSIDNEPNICFWAVNTSHLPGTFDIYLAEQADDGTLDFHNLAYGSTMEITGFDPIDNTSWVEVEMPESFEGLAPGRHKMLFMHKEAGTQAAWKPLPSLDNYVEVVIDEEGQLAETIFHPLQELSVNSSEISISGTMQRGLLQNISIPITNKGDEDYMGGVRCSIYQYENGVLGTCVSDLHTGAMIEAGTTEEIAFSVSLPVAGPFILVLTKENSSLDFEDEKASDLKEAPGYLGEKLFTINELAFYCLDVQYTERTDTEGNPAYCLDLALGNSTGMTYDAAVMAKFYKPNAEGGYEPVEFSKPFLFSTVRLENNFWCTTSIRLPEPLEPGEYGLELYIANDFRSLMPTDYFVFASGPITVKSGTGISEVPDGSGTSAEEWFDLNGRRLSGKPAAKGVYILNGKKQLIK